jgi:FkbH-like protein
MRLDSSTSEFLLLKRKSLRRELSGKQGLQDVRIAVLGGTTTNEVVDLLELLLLADGFRPEIYQSDYARYYEEAVLSPEQLVAFRPDIVYVATSYMNLRGFPPLAASAEDLAAAVDAEVSRYQSIWSAIQETLGCQIIQNNFELPPFGVLGNLDAVSHGGQSRYVSALNAELARRASGSRKLLIQDVAGLSAQIGLRNWYDWSRWFSYKIITTADASLLVARSLTSLVRAVYGKSRKVLVLDLDNTLWGGVIGDDGPDNIKIGRETPEAEAFTAFQEYCLGLRKRGILLAVASKNEDEIAKKGLAHPDSVLKLEHFAAFRANWSPKHENIQAMAAELNLGVDSFVFVDDNPAERALVEGQLPQVAVPDVGSDVSGFIPVLESARYFESVALSAEDLERAEQYAANTQRATLQAKFADYGEYLASLKMTGEVAAFRSEYLDRIAQLTNKTNQFNLTTRRYTLADIEAMAADAGHVTLYGKLTDMFGDHGLISVVVGRKVDGVLAVDLWLMSCRVLKRDMELAMLDALVAGARKVGAGAIHGAYIKTAKNAMVADHYEKLGFSALPPGEWKGGGEVTSAWALDVGGYQNRNRHITVKESGNG